jgi:hypothetical protein
MLRAVLSEAMALATAEDLSRDEPREVLEIVAGDEVRYLVQAGARYEPGAI